MSDREKVVEALNESIPFVESRGYGGVAQAMHDAVELLNEEPVPPYIQLMLGRGPRFYACGNCWKVIDKRQYNYCPYCGRKVKWDDA